MREFSGALSSSNDKSVDLVKIIKVYIILLISRGLLIKAIKEAETIQYYKEKKETEVTATLSMSCYLRILFIIEKKFY